MRNSMKKTKLQTVPKDFRDRDVVSLNRIEI